jgi:hypothetical protein
MYLMLRSFSVCLVVSLSFNSCRKLPETEPFQFPDLDKRCHVVLDQDFNILTVKLSQQNELLEQWQFEYTKAMVKQVTEKKSDSSKLIRHYFLDTTDGLAKTAIDSIYQNTVLVEVGFWYYTFDNGRLISQTKDAFDVLKNIPGDSKMYKYTWIDSGLKEMIITHGIPNPYKETNFFAENLNRLDLENFYGKFMGSRSVRLPASKQTYYLATRKTEIQRFEYELNSNGLVSLIHLMEQVEPKTRNGFKTTRIHYSYEFR